MSTRRSIAGRSGRSAGTGPVRKILLPDSVGRALNHYDVTNYGFFSGDDEAAGTIAARLVDAFRSNGPAGFRRESASLRAVLASQEMLLSSSDDFCLAPILAKANALPHAPADMEERIRDILTMWAGRILDYAHRDYYEMVRFYYHQRVEAFLAHAEMNLAARRPIVDDKQLDPAYQQMEQSFVKTPFAVAPQERFAGGPLQAVCEILTRHRLSNFEQAQYCNR